jgi:hypothetical protein
MPETRSFCALIWRRMSKSCRVLVWPPLPHLDSNPPKLNYKETPAMDRRVPLLLLLVVMGCAPAIGAGPAASFAEFAFQKPSHGDRGASARVVAQPGQRLVFDLGVDAREHRGGGVGMLSLGGGMLIPSSGSTRMVAGISADAVVGDFGPEDEPWGMDGVSVGAALNFDISHRFNDRLELLGRLKVTTSIEECRSVVTLGARYYLGKRIALAADYLHDDFGARVGVGVRIDFSHL